MWQGVADVQASLRTKYCVARQTVENAKEWGSLWLMFGKGLAKMDGQCSADLSSCCWTVLDNMSITLAWVLRCLHGAPETHEVVVWTVELEDCLTLVGLMGCVCT